jgi:L-lactate dehydrogenase (cytochrome)
MRDVREVDTSSSILGVNVPAPFYISPTARNGLAQPLVRTQGSILSILTGTG